MKRYEDEVDLFAQFMGIELDAELVNDCWVIKGTNKIARGNLKKKNPATEIVLPSFIEEIGDYAFQGYTNLVSIKLNEGLKKIGYGAFLGTKLEKVVIPSTVTEIDNYIAKGIIFEVAEGNKNFEFRDNCLIEKKDKRVIYSADQMKVPEGVEIIGEDSYMCSEIETLIVPDTVKEIGDFAFNKCKKLKKVTLNEGLKRISCEAFSKTKIKEITIPSSVETISSYAFSGCKSLKNVVIQEGVKDICNQVFESSGITSIEIPGSVEEIGSGAFADCKKLKKVTIGEGVKKICESAFCESGIEAIEIPKSVEEIDHEVFAGCTELKTIILNEGLKKIGDFVFTDSGLTSINIPSTVESLGFEACCGLNFTLSEGSKIYEIKGNCLIEKKTKKIIAAQENSEVVEGVKIIGHQAFMKSGIESLKLPSSVKIIEREAFAECQNLKSVQLNEGLKTIEAGAFMKTGIEEISIPSSVESIGNAAFGGTFFTPMRLKSIVFHEGLKEILSGVFLSCKFETVTIPESVKIMGEKVFSENPNLKVINCRAKTKPVGWESNWNRSSVIDGIYETHDVNWGYEE